MKRPICAIAALVLTSCGSAQSGDDDGPVKIASNAAEFNAHLLPDGIQVPGNMAKRISFGANEADARVALDKALGEPEDVAEGENCEDAPLRMTFYPGNVAFHFREGKFVGWIAQQTKSPTVATPEGIVAKSKIEAASRAYDLDETLWPSPMGKEYTTDDGYSFFALNTDEGEEILAITAGAVCFR